MKFVWPWTGKALWWIVLPTTYWTIGFHGLHSGSSCFMSMMSGMSRYVKICQANEDNLPNFGWILPRRWSRWSMKLAKGKASTSQESQNPRFQTAQCAIWNSTKIIKTGMALWQNMTEQENRELTRNWKRFCSPLSEAIRLRHEFLTFMRKYRDFEVDEPDEPCSVPPALPQPRCRNSCSSMTSWAAVKTRWL